MKFIRIFLLLYIFLCNDLFAQKQEWNVTGSKISFQIKNAGLTVDGTLSGLNSKILFDEQSASNSIEASVETKSINTNNNLRDKHLKEKDYFEVTTFPKIIIKSIRISKEKNGNYSGLFLLTIKGKTKTITIPFTFKEKNTDAIINGSFSINRLDFEVGDSSFILSDNVTVSIELRAVKK